MRPIRLALLCLVMAALLAAACDGEEEAEPTATGTTVDTAEPTSARTPGLESGWLSQAAPGEGTFVIDLAAERWLRVRAGHGELLQFGGVSPDGDTIIYRDDTGLVAIRFDGTEPRRIVDADRSAVNVGAVFSPNGETLAAWGFTRGPTLTLLAWPDGEPTAVDLPQPVHYAAWSGDVLAVATGDPTFVTVNAIYFVSLDGEAVLHPVAVAPGFPPFVWAQHEPRLAYSTAVDPDNPSAGSLVFTLRPGEQPQRLVELPGETVSHLSWSSDGELLAVGIGHPSSEDPRYFDQDVRVIDAATGDTRFTVTSAGYLLAAWSPAQPVLLLDSACGDQQLLLVDGDGSDLRPLVDEPPGSPAGHVWSPDGRQVATTWAEESAVTAIDVESGERRTLIRGPQPIVGLQWPAVDRLVFTTSAGFGTCEQVLGGETRVVFP